MLPAAGCWMLKAEGWRLEAGGWKLEAGRGWRRLAAAEAGGWRFPSSTNGELSAAWRSRTRLRSGFGQG